MARAPTTKSPQGRDPQGRFVGRRRTRSRVGTSRIGRRGPSHLADKDQLSLARILVMLVHKVGRLKAERDGREWKDPEPVRKPNMRGIERGRATDGAKRLRAVERAVIHFAGRRKDPSREDFLKRVAKEYGSSFGEKTLYREPYVSVWAPHLSRPETPQDSSALMAVYKRWPRRHLIQWILRMQDELAKLGFMAKANLLEDDGEDWSALPSSGRD